MGADYTGFFFYPVLLLGLCAIASVPLLAFSMTIAVKGFIVAPEKRVVFVMLFLAAAVFAAFFFFAVMKYEWLGGDTVYDGLYHSTGYFGSIMIGIVAIATARLNNIKYRKIAFYSCGAAVGFLMFNAMISPAYAVGSRPLAYSIGFLYASIQFIFPMAYYFYIKQPDNKQFAILERDALAKYGPNVSIVKTVPGAALPPQNITIPIYPQPGSGDVSQDSNNRQ